MSEASVRTWLMDFLLYYMSAFLLEEDVLDILLTHRGRRRLLRSRFLSAEFCLLHYPIIGVAFLRWIPHAFAEAAAHCVADLRCRRLSAHSRLESIDLSDGQWRAFRAGLPMLLLFAACALAAGRAASSQLGHESRWRVDLVLGLGLLLFLHGGGALWHLLLAIAFHALARSTMTTWALAAAVIVLKEPRIARQLRFEPFLGSGIGGALDGWRGAYPWFASMGLTLLRLVSYATERNQYDGAAVTVTAQVAAAAREAASAKSAEASDKAASQTMSTRVYTLPRLLAYVHYAPLFLAGPTLTFDSYERDRLACTGGLAAAANTSAEPPHYDGGDRRHQWSPPAPFWSSARLLLYALRLAGVLLALEHALRTYPVFAIANSCLGALPPAAAAASVFLLLNGMWLKFCAMWRLARLWALLDGVHAPENMLRCLCGSYSTSGFWRGWHASFNQWLLRYLYRPLTRSASLSRPLAAALTFAFTALWHDFELRLLAWAAVNIAALLLERALATAVAPRVRQAVGGTGWRWRHLRAAGGVASIFNLVAVNAIGYGGGFASLRGVSGATGGGIGAAHACLVAASAAFFFALTHVIIELREVVDASRLEDSSI